MQHLFLIRNQSIKNLNNPDRSHRLLKKKKDKTENQDQVQVNESDHHLMTGEKGSQHKIEQRLEFLIIQVNLRDLKHQK